MKHLKEADFAAQIGSWEETWEPLAELWECLSCCLADDSDTSQASRLRQSLLCDRLLWICVEQMAKPRVCPAHVDSAVAPAKVACHSYLTTVPQPAPLYLERIL